MLGRITLLVSLRNFPFSMSPGLSQPTPGQSSQWIWWWDEKPLVMALDTGASVSLVLERTLRKLFPRVPLEHSEIQLSTYS